MPAHSLFCSFGPATLFTNNKRLSAEVSAGSDDENFTKLLLATCYYRSGIRFLFFCSFLNTHIHTAILITQPRRQHTGKPNRAYMILQGNANDCKSQSSRSIELKTTIKRNLAVFVVIVIVVHYHYCHYQLPLPCRTHSPIEKNREIYYYRYFSWLVHCCYCVYVPLSLCLLRVSICYYYYSSLPCFL